MQKKTLSFPSPELLTQRPPFPRKVMIQTTSRCNSGCVFCPYREVRKEFPQGEMEEDLFQSILDELSRYKEVERVIPYLMNEPLCDKRIISWIYRIKERLPWVQVHILTNGINLHSRLRKELLNSPLDWVGISIHAIRADTYRRFTGREDFPEILRRITLFVQEAMEKRGEDFVMINITRVPGFLTEEEKEEAILYWKNLGVKRIEYYPAPVSRAGNITWLSRIRHTRIKGCRSIWRNEMIHILYHGEVVLCCMDWRREMVMGNVRENSLKDIWNSPRYMEVESWIRGEGNPPPDFLCFRCEEAEE